MISRAWNQSFPLTQWLKIIHHMIRSCYRCCCINEPVIFSHFVNLKLGHWFHALSKVCTDSDDTAPLRAKHARAYPMNGLSFDSELWTAKGALSPCSKPYRKEKPFSDGKVSQCLRSWAARTAFSVQNCQEEDWSCTLTHVTHMYLINRELAVENCLLRLCWCPDTRPKLSLPGSIFQFQLPVNDFLKFWLNI